MTRKRLFIIQAKGLPFSELKYSKLIFEKDRSAYNQYQYANSLRLCGYARKSEENLIVNFAIKKSKRA